MFKKTTKWLIFVCILFGAFTIILVLYRVSAKPSTFLTTSSPKGTYKVNLTGQKERPVFFTNEVRFHVIKNGKPFVSDKYLHSGDSFDLSFESGYPNNRWLEENILHFYKEENFNAGEPDTLYIFNKTNNVIKYIVVYSTDKFLLLDIQPRSETKLSSSPSKGDYPGVFVEGDFADGRSFKKGSGFVINKVANRPFTYYINITNEDLTIESPELQKYRSPS